jgi:hypothetical protein
MMKLSRMQLIRTTVNERVDHEILLGFTSRKTSSEAEKNDDEQDQDEEELG